jgi:hypothetical protein
MAQNLG